MLRGRQLCRLARERRDAGEVARRDRLPGRDPGAADGDYIGQREIGRGVAHMDSAGGAEAQRRQGCRHRLEPGHAACRFGGKEFQHLEAALGERKRLRDGGAARERRHRRSSERVGERRRCARCNQELRAGFQCRLDIEGIVTVPMPSATSGSSAAIARAASSAASVRSVTSMTGRPPSASARASGTASAVCSMVSTGTSGARRRSGSRIGRHGGYLGDVALRCKSLFASRGHARYHRAVAGRDEWRLIFGSRSAARSAGSDDWCTEIAARWFGLAFPWGTLFINVLGSFIVGIFFTLTGPDGRFDASLNAKAFVMVGICGGYTTFSAFSLQTLALMHDGAWLRAGAYILASVVLCLVAVWVGHAIAQLVNAAT